MPFTASHIAAVLPLSRGPLIASALVIGSMSPDIPYYVHVPVDARVTHSAVGIISVDLLLGLGVFLLWHGILVGPMLASAPASLRGRIPALAVAGLRARVVAPARLLLVIVSLSTGAATHVVWDAFTHSGRWGTTHIAWLAARHGPLDGYRWAQYASGLLGALVVALWLVHWWRHTAAVPSRSGLPPAVAAAGWVAVLVAGAVGAAFGSLDPLTLPERPDLRSAAFLAVTQGIVAASAIALLLAVTWHLVTGRQPTQSPGGHGPGS